MSLFVDMSMENIALVTLDNKNKGQVLAKIFLENLLIKFASFQDGKSVIQIDIDDLRGSHLLQNKSKFYEKGFIGDFAIQNVYQTESPEELKQKFLENLLQ